MNDRFDGELTAKVVSRHDATVAAPPAAGIHLPLVSVVVVNFNYALFIEEAVASVFGQTYDDIECIIVDDASTDDSPAVLGDLGGRFPKAQIIQRPVNGGQTLASLDGLAAARGQYVIFLDADDVLLPRCVETHVLVHLSLRTHVGFTSGDMLQVVDQHIVVSTGSALNSFIRRRKPSGHATVRPYRHAFGPWPDAEFAHDLSDKIFTVPALYNRWVWAPTSGNCYRRDALRLFADNPGLTRLRTCSDMYFSHAIGALSGSALIDVPVFAYRVHGSNMLTQSAQLHGSTTYQQGGSGDNNDLARRLIVDQFVAHLDRFASHPLYWFACLMRLDHRGDKAARSRWERRSQAAVALVANYPQLVAAFGAAAPVLLLVFGVPPTVILRARRLAKTNG